MHLEEGCAASLCYAFDHYGQMAEYLRMTCSACFSRCASRAAARLSARGAIASYTNHKSRVLELPCSPRPYGASNDHAYAGAICITQPDRLPEAGGLRVLTSDFLLIRADDPQVVWRQTMSALGAGDNDRFEWASAVIRALHALADGAEEFNQYGQPYAISPLSSQPAR